jgi:hypothetical protein
MREEIDAEKDREEGGSWGGGQRESEGRGRTVYLPSRDSPAAYD